MPATPTHVPEPSRTDPALLRNFCIIAHIDHGKSTLADRMLQLTGVVDSRQMRAQYLDRMDIERERGITIKSQAVRLPWAPTTGDGAGKTHILNMIDTPGHVDFTYEVSRSLAACEGTVLLVDAAQGIEAQTLANLYLAMENDLAIVPVLNKIDLPAAQPEKFAEELANLIGCDPDDVLKVSAKTGLGVEALLDRVVQTVPHPVGVADAPARAMIFDSVYDSYRGVVTYVRVVDGQLNKRERIRMMSTGATHELLEIGVSSPEMTPADGVGVGEVGYIITGVKDVRQSKVGDTITSLTKGATEALGGYKDPKPMVFSGLYPLDGSDYPELREALDKLQLNDAALVYEPETSAALGFGFRVGFLGLLHLDVIRERLEREFGLDLIATAPNVVYRVTMEDGSEHIVTNPSEFPEGKIDEVHEPVVKATILAPTEFIGAIMELCQTRRGTLLGMDYLSEDRVEIRYTLPSPRSSSTSSTSSSPRPAATPPWTTSPPASSPPRWSRSTSCCTATRSTPSPRSPTRTLRTRTACGWSPSCASSSPGRTSRCRSRRRSVPGSSPVRPSARSARTSSPSATAVTSPVSGSCWRSRRKARSG